MANVVDERKISAEARLRLADAISHVRVAQEIVDRCCADATVNHASEPRVEIARAQMSLSDAARTLARVLQAGGWAP
jgi:hypothetical protein